MCDPMYPAPPVTRTVLGCDGVVGVVVDAAKAKVWWRRKLDINPSFIRVDKFILDWWIGVSVDFG